MVASTPSARHSTCLRSPAGSAGVVAEAQIDARAVDGSVEADGAAVLLVIADAVRVLVPFDDRQAGVERGPERRRRNLADAAADARHRGVALDRQALLVAVLLGDRPERGQEREC